MYLLSWQSLLMTALIITAGESIAASVTLHFYERPPFMIRQPDGSASGLTADPTSAVFNRAGISFRWQSTPAKRQLNIIEFGSAANCGVGWFRNAERERYAQFSQPIYRDLPPVVIARQQFQIADGAQLIDVLADSRTRILVKDGLTYGTYIGTRLKTAAAKVERLTIEQTQLIRMVAAGRADLMFAAGEEARLLVTMDEAGAAAVKLMHFSDIPVGEARHIMCSRSVPVETMTRLDQAISALGYP